MSEVNSTVTVSHAKSTRPAKPNPNFPLTAHPAGYWCKKILGKVHYFGRWDNPDAALAKYNRQKEDLHAGRKPREEKEPTAGQPRPEATDEESSGDITLGEVCSAFLLDKQALVENGELSPRTFSDYKDACRFAIKQLGGKSGKLRPVSDLKPADFSALRRVIAKKWGFYRTGNVIGRIRSVFKFASEEDIIDKPVKFGSKFKKPNRKTIRKHKSSRPKQLYTRQEILSMLATANAKMKAMILLGINAGMGPADCAGLPMSALDLDNGWLDYPRPKTGKQRRAALWPETVKAIKDELSHRGEMTDDLVFLSELGLTWQRDTPASPISFRMRILLNKLKIGLGRGFYTLRHTYRTIADGTKDQVAVDHTMGHGADDMASRYREGIDDSRLRAVADHVRAWLFSTGKEGGPA